jgi:hypothetical protein
VERRNQSTESILLIFLDHYYLEPHDQDDISYKISVRVEAILPAYGTPTEHPTVDTMIRGKQCIKRLLADMEYLAKFIQLIIMSKVHA